MEGKPYLRMYPRQRIVNERVPCPPCRKQGAVVPVRSHASNGALEKLRRVSFLTGLGVDSVCEVPSQGIS
jgi:hypothetical protein